MSDRIDISNRKASFEYFLMEKISAGMVLLGSEVKGIKESSVSFVDSFCYFKGNELWLKGVHIGVPKYAAAWGHDPLRERKLLLSKKELTKWKNELVPTTSIIPIKIFSNERGKLKIEIALAKGKKNFDKRDSLKRKDQDRDLKRELNEN